MNRRNKMLGPDGAKGAGLEIGALHAPLISKTEHDVLYVDYATTDVLRANQFDPSIDRDALVEVDIVWGETRLLQAVGRQVDFIVASHVIEHVPDLIGWLAELHEVLRPGGMLALAIPDKRFTFDALRQESTLAEAVEAHIVGSRRPSARQLFEAASLGVEIDSEQVWRGEMDPRARRPEVLDRIGSALDLARRVHESGRYRDAHCWVFTPTSFLDLIEELAVLEFFPFRVEAFHPTDQNGTEFYIRLAALPAGQTQEAVASIRTAAAGVAKASGPSYTPDRRAEVEHLRGDLDAVYASTSWKLTAPMRALGGAFKRLSARRR
jgi:SAM-dependent methyltransferase